MMAYFKNKDDYAKTDDPKEYDKLMYKRYHAIKEKEYRKGKDNEQ